MSRLDKPAPPPRSTTPSGRKSVAELAGAIDTSGALETTTRTVEQLDVSTTPPPSAVISRPTLTAVPVPTAAPPVPPTPPARRNIAGSIDEALAHRVKRMRLYGVAESAVLGYALARLLEGRSDEDLIAEFKAAGLGLKRRPIGTASPPGTSG